MSIKKPLLTILCLTLLGIANADEPSSYMPVVIKEDFQTIFNKMSADKISVNNKQSELLNKRHVEW